MSIVNYQLSIDKRTQADYSIDESVQLSAEDVKILIDQSKQFIKIAEIKL